MAMVVAGVPHPELDLEALFLHYNDLYFDSEIASCSVNWSDSSMTSGTGLCNYQKSSCSCEIILSEPLLRNRSADDLKNTLLHEMIHAYLFFSNNNSRHDAHGEGFKEMMNSINSSTITDCLRPNNGYKITLFHDFHDDVADDIAHKWECELCHEKINRATPKPPSHNDCILQVHYMKRTCGNSDCSWHRHKDKCGGTFKKISGPSENQANTISCAKLNISEERVKSQVKVNKEITNFISPSSKLNWISIPGSSRSPTKISIPGSSQSPTGISNPGSFQSPTGISIPGSSRSPVGISTPKFSISPQGNPGSSFPKKEESSRKRKFRTPINNQSNSQGAPSIQQHKVVSKMLDYYEDGSTDEEIEPLVNKRSVRRKKLERILNGGQSVLERRQLLIGPPPAGGPGFSQEDALEISDDE
ncbi:hypothetical protein LUZ60_003136 [Juncus effusus]|nr:hypothetical protein LUZ60_003136 [Juncus effusus]